MALISIIKDFHPLNDAKLLDTAAQYTPVLHHKVVEPVGGFTLKDRYSPELNEIDLHQVRHLELEKGKNLCLDFGEHHVGYLTLHLSYTGSHPDAPAFLKLKFAETFRELFTNSEEYDGWISSSWIQEEYIHVDVLPTVLRLPRRYAFRYLKITMMDTSPKYRLTVSHAEILTESSADSSHLPAYTCPDPELDRIDKVSIRTLENCMQDVFEDGPKRDKRLWLGDLRLQALTNYFSFGNVKLVKRCLYLFAGSRFPDGRVAACMFTQPSVEADDTYLSDYALFFICTLEEYLEQMDGLGKPDQEALDDLYDIAMVQLEIAFKSISRESLVGEELVSNVFIDWNDDVEKTACTQGALIYAIRYARRLARRKNDWSQSTWLADMEEKLKKAAMKNFWDEEKGLFVSKGQFSIHTQVWMTLADLLCPEDSRKLMERSRELLESGCPMQTPYMHHYYLIALLRCGLKEDAIAHIKEYWGSMLKAGADTFWEAWNPKDPEASPYGSFVINSYCHAWSCTPSYIIRKYLYPMN